MKHTKQQYTRQTPNNLSTNYTAAHVLLSLLWDWLARNGSASVFVGPEPVLGVSRQNLRNKISLWLGNQHRSHWQNLGNSQRQAHELISRPCWGTSVRFLSFNRIQSRVVTGLLTWHNTLYRHLHLMGLLDSPLCRKCAAEDETSAHSLSV
jgi:hypothetical protein